MRIGVNAFPLRVARGGAVYTFAGLMGALSRASEAHAYVLFCHPTSVEMLNKMLGTAARQIRTIAVGDEEEIQNHRDEFDLYFGPLNDLRPRIYDRPTVAMLMDIQQEYFPEMFSRAELMARRDAYLEMCRAATVVVTISEFCKQTFIQKYGIDARKIEVMHLAPQAGLTDVEAGKSGGEFAWRRAALPANYFLYPSNFYPHKNHAILLDAIDKLGGGTSVVFAGNPVPGGFPLAEEIKRRGLSSGCRIVQNLSAAEMGYLYTHAAATVMPTRFEGFGIPAAEALTCGCALVCADIPALREVAGESAVYFSPDDVDELCGALRNIIANETLRNGLIESGRERAKQFTWEAAARKMLGVFDQACRQFKDGYEQSTATMPEPRVGYAKFDDDDPSELLDLARRENLDLVGQLSTGERQRGSALDSLRYSFRAEPSKAVHIGEVCVWRGEEYAGVSRLRRTGDELWKIEGMLYPAMIFISPRALARWPEGMAIFSGGGADWQWKLVRAAFAAKQIAHLRRTLADCVEEHGIRGKGMSRYYRCEDGRMAGAPLLRRFEESVRRISQRLPLPVQRAGTVLWYRMAR